MPEEPGAGDAGAQPGGFTFPFPPREFPDRGAKWLLSHPAHLRHLLRILAPDIGARIDFTQLAPVPTELLSERLRKQLADLIFRAPLREGDQGEEDDQGEATIFILVEHQSTPSPLMRFRVLFYMVQLWDLQCREAKRDKVPEGQWRLHPIIPVVFYTGADRWEQPLALDRVLAAPALLERFVPRFDLLFLPLRDTAVEALHAEDSAFGQVLRLVRQADDAPEAFRAGLTDVVHHLEQLTADDADEWHRLLYYLLLFVWHHRAPAEFATLEHALDSVHGDRLRHQEIEAMSKTIVQHFIEEGEARGEARGETRGEARGRRLMLLNQLQAKFGALPADTEGRLQQRSLSELDQLAVALIRTESLDELGL